MLISFRTNDKQIDNERWHTLPLLLRMTAHCWLSFSSEEIDRNIKRMITINEHQSNAVRTVDRK